MVMTAINLIVAHQLQGAKCLEPLFSLDQGWRSSPASEKGTGRTAVVALRLAGSHGLEFPISDRRFYDWSRIKSRLIWFITFCGSVRSDDVCRSGVPYSLALLFHQSALRLPLPSTKEPSRKG
jgi:hypothetical protein